MATCSTSQTSCGPNLCTSNSGRSGLLSESAHSGVHSFQVCDFPSKPLKPKHHHLCHYPELIKQFGSLIRLWTMRFESRHTYFKQCARKLHTFKNLSATLAERHQFLQAYLSPGKLFQLSVQVERGSESYSDDYNEAIRESIDHLDFQPGDTLVATEITLKVTKYRKAWLCFWPVMMRVWRLAELN